MRVTDKAHQAVDGSAETITDNFSELESKCVTPTELCRLEEGVTSSRLRSSQSCWRPRLGVVAGVALATCALVALALSVRNLQQIGRLSSPHRQDKPQSARLSEFFLDVSNTGACPGDPCWEARRYMTAGSLGPLKHFGELAEDFELTPDRRHIRALRDSVYIVDAAARVRFSSGDLHLSGGLAINGVIGRRVCEHEMLQSEPGTAVTDVSLVCKLNILVTLRAGDKVTMKLRMLSRQELQTTEASTYIRAVRLP